MSGDWLPAKLDSCRTQKRRSPHLESWKGMNVKKRRSECQTELVWMKIDEVSVLNAHMLHDRLYPELTPADSEIFMEPIMKAPDRRNWYDQEHHEELARDIVRDATDCWHHSHPTYLLNPFKSWTGRSFALQIFLLATIARNRSPGQILVTTNMFAAPAWHSLKHFQGFTTVGCTRGYPDESLAIAAMGNVDNVVSGISGPFPCFAGSKRRSQLLVGWSHLGTVLWPGGIKLCGKWWSFTYFWAGKYMEVPYLVKKNQKDDQLTFSIFFLQI